MDEKILCYIPARTRVWDDEGDLVADEIYLYPIRATHPENIFETLQKGAEKLGVSVDELALEMHKEKFLKDPQNKAEFHRMNADKVEITLAGEITWRYKL